MKKFSIVVTLFFLLVFIVGCSQNTATTPEEEVETSSEPTAVSPTETAAETETAVPDPDPTATPQTEPELLTNNGVTDPNWWDNAIFYEVFVRSFADSDGDGVGDLNGLIENLDYLNDGDPNTTDDLGVTGIWLMPISQSPSYHGYDVVDYYQVDDEYGTNEDFLRLMEEANARGIRVIVDLVMNHTSSQHPWFVEAQDPASEYRDWYVWADNPEGPGWHETANGSYYGYFWDGMPDINVENEEATAAIQDVIRFWLEDMGADGFRLDAIKHLIEDGRIIENTPETHQWLAQEFYPVVKESNPDALTVGEVWSTTDDVVPYIGDEVDLAFEFSMATGILDSTVSERKVNVERAQTAVIEAFPPGQYATFLANHDQNRTRSVLLSDEQAKVAATLQLMSPGVPFIYYGEEIGMQGEKPDENIRRPMQWNADGGFSEAAPWHPYFEDVTERHVAGQNEDPNSLLNHYRRLIALRNAHPVLQTGGWALVETDHKSVYAFLRFDEEDAILVLVNLWRNPVEEYQLNLAQGPLLSGVRAELIMGDDIQSLTSPKINEQTGGFDSYQPLPVLPPYSSTVIQFSANGNE